MNILFMSSQTFGISKRFVTICVYKLVLFEEVFGKPDCCEWTAGHINHPADIFM